MNILSIGGPGGTYESISSTILTAYPDSTIKYVDSYSTALTMIQDNPTLCVYNNWLHLHHLLDDTAPKPVTMDNFVGWFSESHDSIVSTNKDLNDFLNTNTPISIGIYYHPVRVSILSKQLEAMGIKAHIKTFDCFSPMLGALLMQEIDFLCGNSISIYEEAGGIEILTTRLDDKIPHFSRYIQDESLANTKTRFGVIGFNIDIDEVIAYLHSNITTTAAITDRGYLLSDFFNNTERQLWNL